MFQRMFGCFNVSSYLSCLPLPLLKSDKYHLIRTHATALTSGELRWPEPLLPTTPIPGYDLAGTIVSTPSHSKFKPGDEVYALTSFSRQGNAREYSVALEEELALRPKNVEWEEAASVPLSALSAWQGLFVHAGLKVPGLQPDAKEAGKKQARVLVTAAAGGVGVWGVQLAHAAGAEVMGTCGRANVEFVKGLGADEVVDYAQIGLKQWVGGKEERKFDVILDCVGGQTLTDAWTCVREYGIIISVAEPPEGKKPGEGVSAGVRQAFFIVDPHGSQLAQITSLIEEGICKGVVDSAWALGDWENAFQKLSDGHARGKVVLKLGVEI
ncbi:NAD(P)-binding protein [Lophium mytilinum]|uniref:NAD(P)-binding protein n=1 Tax=Lophium mytilinum TaxID=390894 RepID=A0A6A6R780_9PEZI|nr:NAD(P)-binding protein [Lophium mytilinum]